ncbi:MAG: type III-B CRISPR-associated protein Cas10/Cmr2 [Rhodocyclaceae bacterium]|nr:type III-B CRISPR-associated protein Cas10/Cmr2 [Rhodocyclaceae bacterium]
MTNELIWQTKLAARIHDPAEKALVLLRDPAGHEGGTSRALTRLLGLSDITMDTLDPDNTDALTAVMFKKGIPLAMYRHIQCADWWAAAADRPQWPMQEITVDTKVGKKTFAVAPWAQVRWTKSPVLIHPLTGYNYDLGQHGGLGDTDLADIKERSFNHFSNLLTKLYRADPTEDPQKTLLAYWRFGPELAEDEDFGKLGALWRLLPADTRVPDHSIWDHLDLTSAFAGAFAADPEGEAALLTLAIGPVQGFIAAARTTSDLWAGSHLLARLAWEAMKPVCEALGPDAILFPRLRGVPQVDLWLRDEMKLSDELFKDCEWARGGTDSNPLFSAALPNRFVAVVPASQARALAETVSLAVRRWLQAQGQEVVDRLLDVAGLSSDSKQHCHRQMESQLEGFPEVHWAAVPFSLIRPRNKAKQTDLDTLALSEAMAPYFGAKSGEDCGFLASPAWKILRQEAQLADGTVFFAPNPGALYPAVHDLAERVLAAAKAVRTFEQTTQQGWRCSLTGETEWLTHDADHLKIPTGKRKSRQDDKFRDKLHVETLWTRVADEKPAWARKGEHLGALPALKRLWPTLFAKEVGRALGGKDIGRFVVSTHTMALAHQLDQWLEQGGKGTEDLAFDIRKYRAEPVALPRRLMRPANAVGLADAKFIPGLLDVAADPELSEGESAAIRKRVRQTLANGRNRGEEIRLETYYSLLMLDGDRMGVWLSGGNSEKDNKYAISYRESFHPDVGKGFDEVAARQPLIRQYGQQKRALSPNRHLAISGALNDYSLSVVRHVVETEHLGRVIYAGGDDVLAMLPVADLLSAMKRLRHAYSGHDPEHAGGVDASGLRLHNGFASLNGRLMRMMGTRATASCGAVIAHHQAPLTAVMRELRAAEVRAKTEGGRDAFSLTVVKRSGGALHLTAKWGEPVALLADLSAFLSDPDVSRRAVYHSLEWLTDLPEPEGDGAMLASLLAYQFDRQGKAARARHDLPGLARRLAVQAVNQPKEQLKWLANFLSVAEFLARETRSGEEA